MVSKLATSVHGQCPVPDQLICYLVRDVYKVRDVYGCYPTPTYL